jgi:hypothetical protein
MLDALSAGPYFAEGSNSPGLLLHVVGHYPARQELDTTLIYGDYYFQEAVMRYRSMLASPSGGTDGGSRVGGTDGGVSGVSPAAGPQGRSSLSPQQAGAGCQQGGLAGFTFLGLLAVASALRPDRRHGAPVRF